MSNPDQDSDYTALRPKKLKIALLAFLLAAACHKEAAEEHAPVDSYVTVAVVQSAPVFRGDLIERVTARGICRAGNSTSIRPRLAGILAAVPVREGDRVKEGQILLQLEKDYYRIALQEARANYLQASIEYGKKQGERKSSMAGSLHPDESSFLNLEHAEIQLAQVTREFNTGAASEEEFLRARAECEAARLFADPNKEPLIAYQSGLSHSYYQLLKAQGDFDNCTISAPFSGVVAGLSARAGDPASPAQECLKLVDFSQLIVEIGILETEIENVRPGAGARVNVAALPANELRGCVTTISPLIDQRTRTCHVEIRIEHPDCRVKDGMFATAHIDAQSHKNLLLAPKRAVLQRDDRDLVFIVRHNLAKWCYVETGRQNDEYVEIKSSDLNLVEGDHVLTDGHFALVHDAPIQVRTE
ncbi:efflux RND transporter periplasmic adaptor subunit [candidate division KSB1 bacterium]|nr:efflux RND transporter periplasmic adaptor subunit [candidate division KSB1 bacterium]